MGSLSEETDDQTSPSTRRTSPDKRLEELGRLIFILVFIVSVSCGAEFSVERTR